MGASEAESTETVAKPKERQFQVVPMAGLFKRGRWTCRDFWDESDKKKESSEKEKDPSEKEEGTVVPEASTIVVTATSDNIEIPAVTEDTVNAWENTPLDNSVILQKESSTIVVTSIAPHLPTPIHGTPQSLTEPSEMEKLVHQAQQLSHTLPEAASSPPGPHAVLSTVTANEMAATQQNVSPQMTPAATPSGTTEEEGAAIPNVAGTGSPANIDNKIEQAMDLVKTHLTFAVREEIEVMKQTIADLEQRLVAAESENQLLRQYAPVEVVQNLPALVQQQRAQAAPETTTTTAPVLPPTLPAAFCSSALATTLNNVVADVRQQVRYGQPKDQ